MTTLKQPVESPTRDTLGPLPALNGSGDTAREGPVRPSAAFRQRGPAGSCNELFRGALSQNHPAGQSQTPDRQEMQAVRVALKPLRLGALMHRQRNSPSVAPDCYFSPLVADIFLHSAQLPGCPSSFSICVMDHR